MAKAIQLHQKMVLTTARNFVSVGRIHLWKPKSYFDVYTSCWTATEMGRNPVSDIRLSYLEEQNELTPTRYFPSIK
ncbi:MAG: hypothetical protein WA012_11915 [Rhodoferax sp.]|uniref:hypothetical protein n=1 Tax=Rhodoferax sp. TaxID=50421 RepID=UPI003BAFD907